MLKSLCASILEEAPGFAALLSWPESEVLSQHCCGDRTFPEVAAAVGLTPGEARLLHDRASERLTTAVDRLLADLELDRLSAGPASILEELWQQGARPSAGQAPRRLSLS